MRSFTLYETLLFLLSYTKIKIYDAIQFYLTYLLLTLPTFVFTQPFYCLKQTLEFDSDSEEEEGNKRVTETYEVFITKLSFYLRSKTEENFEVRKMHGSQLRMFIDDSGKFYLGSLQKFFPDLEMITMKYAKVDKLSSSIVIRRKKINVPQKYDILNNVSCSLGVVL